MNGISKTALLTCTILLLCSQENLGAVVSSSQELPTLYEYFTADGITSGLTADTAGFFKLNGKDIRLMTGALHYYRVHPALWQDHLRKLRAAGLNAVETYVAWNWHEPEKDNFDFGKGGNEWSEFADIRRFLQIAQEEDLLVILRPGPYVCTEWDFGGFPSWLLRDPEMRVRTSYQPYLDRSKIYLDNLFAEVGDLEFTKGGSIIAVQLENEYGFFSEQDKVYLQFILNVFKDNGLTSLFFTSDGPSSGTIGSLPEEGVLLTGNFNQDVDNNFGILMELQPNRPLMVMEYYSGWLDHWFEDHHTVSVEQYVRNLEIIYGNYNGSANIYMFYGGTNFGFMAGANYDGNAPYYLADTTSYDYNATMSEAGDYSEKFMKTIELSQKYGVPQLKIPELIPESTKVAYPSVLPTQYLAYEDILSQVPSSGKFNMETPIPMEYLSINNDNGQSYGYIVYRTTAVFGNGAHLKIGNVKDYGILIIDGVIHPNPFTHDWINSEAEFELQVSNTGIHTIDIFVENMGRVNFGGANDFKTTKGLPDGTVELDGTQLTGFEVFALEFRSTWVISLTNYTAVGSTLPEINAPAIFQTMFEITGIPGDTFIEMADWTKGIIFVNGFNLGRYWQPVGPQKTLYLPAPVLKTGNNIITVFEQLKPGTEIQFKDAPIWG